MKHICRSLLLMLCISIAMNTAAFRVTATRVGATADSMKFFDGQDFIVIGKLHQEQNYVRLPARFKGTVREPVWQLGLNSAGISIRFRTNSTSIAIRWTVKDNNDLPHMPATGVKGVDLYGYVGDHWQFVNTGRPSGKSNEYVLLDGGDGVEREYLLNLPLYDGVDSLRIGVHVDAEISAPKDSYLIAKKPVVYYGSSIAQGGVASRPGLAFTNILSRVLDRPFINLGFSGQGTFDSSVGEAMCASDPALYVIDCNPNTPEDLVYDGALRLVQLLKRCHPGIPVLLVEGFTYDTDAFRKKRHASVEKKRAALKKAFDTLQRNGIRQLYYQKGNELIGHDHEATVDGVHPNDIGMMRIAEALAPVIRRIVEKPASQ